MLKKHTIALLVLFSMPLLFGLAGCGFTKDHLLKPSAIATNKPPETLVCFTPHAPYDWQGLSAKSAHIDAAWVQSLHAVKTGGDTADESKPTPALLCRQLLDWSEKSLNEGCAQSPKECHFLTYLDGRSTRFDYGEASAPYDAVLLVETKASDDCLKAVIQSMPAPTPNDDTLSEWLACEKSRCKSWPEEKTPAFVDWIENERKKAIVPKRDMPASNGRILVVSPHTPVLHRVIEYEDFTDKELAKMLVDAIETLFDE